MKKNDNPLKSAKDLAFKAYCDGLKLNENEHFNPNDPNELQERFENWWIEWYGDRHGNSFLSNCQLDIFVGTKRYIQGE